MTYMIYTNNISRNGYKTHGNIWMSATVFSISERYCMFWLLFISELSSCETNETSYVSKRNSLGEKGLQLWSGNIHSFEQIEEGYNDGIPHEITVCLDDDVKFRHNLFEEITLFPQIVEVCWVFLDFLIIPLFTFWWLRYSKAGFLPWNRKLLGDDSVLIGNVWIKI